MLRHALNDVLRSHRDARATLNVGLVTGHQFDATVGAIGDDWFSVETIGADSFGAVISHSAIRVITSTQPTQSETYAPVKTGPVLEVMLESLSRLNKRVLVHTGIAQWSGEIAQVGEEYVELAAPSRVIILTNSIQWIRVV